MAGQERSRVLSTEVTGTVHGDTIALDATVPGLDGQRVRVLSRPDEGAEAALSEADQQRDWREWADHGPQGPLDDDDAWPADA